MLRKSFEDGRTSANVDCKVLQELDTPRGVADLRVSLDTEDGLLLVSDGSIWRVSGSANGDKTLRQLAQLVSVGHVLGVN